jgi:hypothetical protein
LVRPPTPGESKMSQLWLEYEQLGRFWKRARAVA